MLCINYSIHTYLHFTDKQTEALAGYGTNGKATQSINVNGVIPSALVSQGVLTQTPF